MAGPLEPDSCVLISRGHHGDFPQARFHIQEAETLFATGLWMLDDDERFAYLAEHVAELVHRLFEKRVVFCAGIEHCDILDRERLRIELDSPAGFFMRFQYLKIPLSEAEQASFLAQYGDRVQEVVSTGFQRVERTLNRLLFLQESGDVLNGIYVLFRLKEVIKPPRSATFGPSP